MEPSYSQKLFSIWRPSWICKFLNFCHVSVARVNICVCVPNFVKFGRFAAEIWRYNDFQNGDSPPCWIYCDVIILYRKTEFNALDIVLSFDIHRFHTFWYTSTIMFHHFSLKFPTIAVIFTFFEKVWEMLNLNVITPKGTSVRETKCLNSICVT